MEHQSLPTDETSLSAAPVSSFSGLIEVFYQPAAWFEKLRSNPKVLVPYIVLAVLSVLLIFAIKDQLINMILAMPKIQDQLASGEIPREAEQYLWIGGAASMAFGYILAPLLAAALAMFWGNFVFAGKASFKALLSVMLYGDLIFAVGNLLIVPLVWAKDSLAVGLNLGVLVANRGFQDPLFIALSKVDLFIIWEIIAIGIGLSVIYRFPRNKGLWLSVLSMGLLTVFGIAGAFIGSLFQ